MIKCPVLPPPHMASSDSDAESPPPNGQPMPQAGAGGTEFLLREVAGGQKTEAWGLLSQKCVHYLKSRFGRSSFPQGIEFSDFLSDVMLKILTSIETFEHRGEGSFWRWVQTLAGNLWRDQWRKHNRDKKLGLLGRGASDSQAFSIPEAAPTDDETPTQLVRFRELEAAESKCVAKLSATMQEVYVLRRQQDLSFAEISKRLGGANEATLRSHYMRARDKVRDCLGLQIDALGRELQGWQ